MKPSETDSIHIIGGILFIENNKNTTMRVPHALYYITAVQQDSRSFLF